MPEPSRVEFSAREPPSIEVSMLEEIFDASAAVAAGGREQGSLFTQNRRFTSEFLLVHASATVAAGRREQAHFARIEQSIVVFDVAHRT